MQVTKHYQCPNCETVWSMQWSTTYGAPYFIDQCPGCHALETPVGIDLSMRDRRKLDLGTKWTRADRISIGRELRADVWDKTGGTCWYCKVTLHPFRDFHVDHVVPVCRGGMDVIENLVPACRSCNMAKGTKTVDEWRGKRT